MRKLGHIYCPTGEWTHASTPTHMHLGGDYYRIFYASRDRQNRGHIFSLDIDINRLKPENVRGPLMSPGRKGTFDDCGLSPACVSGDRLYYLGWSLTKNAPFSNWIGSCFVNDGELERDRESPVLGRSEVDPISVAYPWVLGDTMWYSSNIEWGETDEDMMFVLKTARLFKSGWKPRRKVVIRNAPGDVAVVRPSVVPPGGAHGFWRMWFAIKAHTYSLGYAISYDGVRWIRQLMDKFRPGDFDSIEATYPCVFKHGGEIFMLYNGNGYGKTGFGIAVAG